MTTSQFRSLSIGDAVRIGNSPAIVSNVYMRVIADQTVSFASLMDHNGTVTVDETTAPLIEITPAIQQEERKYDTEDFSTLPFAYRDAAMEESISNYL